MSVPSRRRSPCTATDSTMTQRGRGRQRPGLWREPERVGLVEADIAARIPGVVALLRHVAHLGADHDRLANSVHRSDGEHLVGVGLKDLVPGVAAALLVAGALPFLHVVQQATNGVEFALLALH